MVSRRQPLSPEEEETCSSKKSSDKKKIVYSKLMYIQLANCFIHSIHWIGLSSSFDTARLHRQEVNVSTHLLQTVKINSNALNTVKYINVVGYRNNKIVKANVPKKS